MYNVFIPNVLLENHSVSDGAKLMFCFLYANMENWECTLKNKELGQLMGCSDQSITKRVAELIAHNIIKTHIEHITNGTIRVIRFSDFVIREFEKEHKKNIINSISKLQGGAK